MKKLMLLIAVICTTVFAAPTYKLKNGAYDGKFPVLGPSEPVQYTGDYKVYTVIDNVNYKAYDSQNRILRGRTTQYDVAHVTFTTNETTKLGIWYDIDGKATPGEPHIDLDINIAEYGIYFLDEDNVGIHNYISLINDGIEVAPDREFGVYYKDGDNYYTTTENWVASFDSPSGPPHYLTETTWYENEPSMNRSAYMCLFQGTYDNWPEKLEWEHFEFGFVTGTEAPSGQPLPGTLATIVVAGLCVTGLKKKKH